MFCAIKNGLRRFDKRPFCGRVEATRKGAYIAAALASLTLPACTTTSAATAYTAASISADFYCALSPEARAEFRRKLDLQYPIIQCPQPTP